MTWLVMMALAAGEPAGALQPRAQFGVLQKPQSPWLVVTDVEWAPVYGKLAVGETILYFDAFAAAGFGVAVARPALDFGGGVRLTVRESVAFTVAVLDTAYVEPVGLQHVVMAYAGLSVLLPAITPSR